MKAVSVLKAHGKERAGEPAAERVRAQHGAGQPGHGQEGKLTFLVTSVLRDTPVHKVLPEVCLDHEQLQDTECVLLQVTNAKIACLDFNLQKQRMHMGIQVGCSGSYASHTRFSFTPATSGLLCCGNLSHCCSKAELVFWDSL